MVNYTGLRNLIYIYIYPIHILNRIRIEYELNQSDKLENMSVINSINNSLSAIYTLPIGVHNTETGYTLQKTK